MNSNDLDKGVKLISSQGGVLSARELACLSAGLENARLHEQLTDIYFWGRISADEDDYYICYGLKPSRTQYPNKKFLWT